MRNLKTIFIIGLMFLFTGFSFSQGLNHQEIPSKRGQYESYTASDGTVFKVGERVEIGTPSNGNVFTFIDEGDGILMAKREVTAGAKGQKAEIVKILVSGNRRIGFSVEFKTKGASPLHNYNIQVENALLSGEIIGQTLKNTEDEQDI